MADKKIIGETNAGNPIVAIDHGFGDLRHFIQVDNDLFDLDEAGRWFVQSENSNGIRESIDGYTTEDKQEVERLVADMQADGHDVWVKQI